MLTPPPFDPAIERELQSRSDIVTALTPDEIMALRARVARPTDDEMTLHGAFALTTHEVPASDGHSLAMVVLRPTDADAVVPVLYHVHGGGLVVGTPYEDLPALAATAREVGCAVASIGYRLAPEHPYPTPVEDVYAGLTWLAAQAAHLGLDPERIIIGGPSAGGGLAAAAALLARDRHGPALLGQLLVYPMLDDRNDSASAHQMSGIGAWDRTANETGWSAYLGSASLGAQRDNVPIYAAPARATDLSGLPPMFLDVGSAETFRDEIIAYADRAWLSGGDAELHVWPGGVHGFDALAPEAALSLAARAARVTWLRRLLARSS